MKMSDVFKLPVCSEQPGQPLMDQRGVSILSVSPRVMQAAVKAINEHDDLVQKVVELEQENTELKAHIVRLRSEFGSWFEHPPIADDKMIRIHMDQYNAMVDVFNETPAQSLTEIQAQAIENAAANLEKQTGGSVEFHSGYATAISNLRHYGNELREEAK